MNGAELTLASLAASGAEVCFANPGTTELELVTALDTVDGIRPVLCLFEGVATAAADGWSRMTGRPALTLLHLGPGLANGLANLHNARRAGSPVVTVVGDHATWHLPADAPLTTDIGSLARPMATFVRAATSARRAGEDAAAAVEAALTPPGGPAVLVLSQDAAWGDAGDAPVVAARPVPARPEVADEAVAAAREALTGPGPTVLLVGGSALDEPGLRAAGRVAAGTGARLVHETFVTRMPRGRHLPAAARLGYFPEQAAEQLGGAAAVVLAGTRAPVGFFGYPDGRSSLLDTGTRVVELGGPGHDVGPALAALADQLGTDPAPVPPPDPPTRPTGALTPSTLAAALAVTLPEGAVLVDEGISSSGPWTEASAGAAPHDHLALTGGAIGWGLPAAVGAAVACPDRPVIALQADGSGAYTAQALWTMAREALDVTAVVLNNAAYRILRIEVARAGGGEPGAATAGLTGLDRPVLDWVSLAGGYGVPGRRVTTADELLDALDAALGEPGPHLVEAML